MLDRDKKRTVQIVVDDEETEQLVDVDTTLADFYHESKSNTSQVIIPQKRHHQ